jgi:hypothetical protein
VSGENRGGSSIVAWWVRSVLVLLLRRYALDPFDARNLPHQLRLERAIIAVIGAARLDADARQIGNVLDPVALLASAGSIFMADSFMWVSCFLRMA